MRQALSVASAAVPWVLALFGSPVPAVTGALSTVSAVLSALPKDRQELKKFVQKAAEDLDDDCAHESRELGDADRDAVVQQLVERLLGESDRQRLLGAALIGEPEFRAAVLPEGSGGGLSDDQRGFQILLLARVHRLVLHFAQSPEVIGVASTSALRLTWAQLMLRPTTDQVQRLIQQAVAAELRTRQHIVGTRPRLAAGFVPREEMHRLRDVLADGGAATVCALRGMRGVGKSQLASAFAEECEHGGWRFVGWITAPSREQAVRELAEIARHTGVSAEDDPNLAARALVAWLNSSGPDDRLLVFDNVTDADDVKDLIPHGPGMRVLVTTTRRTSTLGTPVEMGVYTHDQAVTYLTSATGLGRVEGARLVAEDLGWLPVAHTQAAVAMNLYRYSFDRYRELLTQRALDEVMHQEDGDSYPSRVGAALRLAYEAVLKQLDGTAPAVGDAARAALAALSLLAESGVPRDWFAWISSDELTARQTLGELARHSVLTESADQTVVSVHRLQGQVIREDLTAKGELHLAVRCGVALLSSVDLDSGGYFQRRADCSLIGFQLSAINRQGHSRALSDDPDLLAIAGKVLYRANVLSDPHTGISLADYLVTMERVLGADDPQTLTFCSNLASAYQLAGELGQAIPLYLRAAADSERVLGADHRLTLTSRSNLASAYQSAGKLGKAIPLHQRTLADTQRTLGPDHPDTLTSRNNLANAYETAGDLEQAIPLFEQTLTDRLRVLGADHPDTLTSRNNLAHAYLTAGHLEQAITIFQQTLTSREQALGTNHPQTLTSRNNLAGAYLTAGHLEQAIKLYEETLATREQTVGVDHPDTLTSRNNLAYAYQSAGDLEQAITIFQQTLADSERVLGPDHPDTLTSRNNLAGAYETAGDLEQAIPLFEQTLADTERILGAEHPLTLTARNNLAGVYQSAGDLEKAITLLERTLDDRERILGFAHPHTLTSRNNLATACLLHGQRLEALRAMEGKGSL